MKKLIVLMLVASFTGAVIAQQAAPAQTTPAAHSAQTGKIAPMDEKDKKHHHGHHHHRHHAKPGAAIK